MKRFRFPLQPVAILRAHRETQAREAFVAAVSLYVSTGEQLTATQVRVAQVEATLTAGRQQRFSGADEGNALAAYRQERVAEVTAETEMIKARAAMQQRRAEYLDAHRNVEIVKRLEQKARLKHRFECNREEQAVFDDTSARRFLDRRQLFSV